MDLREAAILGACVAQHWYYRAKAKAICRMLAGKSPTRILDVGSGSGYFSRHLLTHTTAVESWCVDTSYADARVDSEGGKAIHFQRSVGEVDADLVLMMDVLEHVDDDVALLRQYAGKVPAGSRFLISVPAFETLWSQHDDFLGHKRRYTLSGLEHVVAEAGLQVERGAYYFAAVLPLAAVVRVTERFAATPGPPKSQLTRHHPLVNRALASACAIELPLMSFNRIAGLTALCLATTPGAAGERLGARGN